MTEHEPKTITKRELIDRIAEATQQTRHAVKLCLQRFLDEIVDELAAGNRLEFRDFGVFDVRVRAARQAQNPRTMEPVTVPRRQSVRFKPGRRMRDLIEGKPPPPPDRIVEPRPTKGPRPPTSDLAGLDGAAIKTRAPKPERTPRQS